MTSVYEINWRLHLLQLPTFGQRTFDNFYINLA